MGPKKRLAPSGPSVIDLTHLRAFVISKFFPGVIPPDPRFKGRGGVGREGWRGVGGEGKGGKGRGKEGLGTTSFWTLPPPLALDFLLPCSTVMYKRY
jgi:hypothetical protein